jgi:hypothetical protein
MPPKELLRKSGEAGPAGEIRRTVDAAAGDVERTRRGDTDGDEIYRLELMFSKEGVSGFGDAFAGLLRSLFGGGRCRPD